MTAQRVQHAMVRDIAGLDGPPLQLIVQHACRKEPVQHICNYLLVCRKMRSAILEHSAGTAEAAYTSAESLQEVEAFAAWLATHGHLLDSLEFGTQSMLESIHDDLEQERDAAEQAVVLAVAKARRRSLHLRTFKLSSSSHHIGDLLEELPGHSLTSLTLNIFQPGSNRVPPVTYIGRLSNSLQHLTSLRELSIDFSAEGWRDDVVLDPMVQQLSALTNLTGLVMSEVSLTDKLRHLPASIKFLSLSSDLEGDDLDLEHLTALTRLKTDEHTGLAGHYILPSSILELSVGDIYDVACVLPLTRLQVLSLQYCDTMHPMAENLQQLSRLTSLKSVDLDYSCESTTAMNNAADAWKLLPIHKISCTSFGGSLSHNTIAQLGELTALTRFTLWLSDKVKCDCALNDFARALCKLTNLEKLHLRNCVRWEDPEKASASQLDPVLIAISELKQLRHLTIEKVPISHRAAKHLAESVACQLTSLTLWKNDLADCDVIAMLLASSRLQQLSLMDNPLTDAILPVIAASCTGLTSLCCSNGTGITVEARKLYLRGF